MATPLDITDAISVACIAHAGQLDKAGRPYIAHPLRMALRAMDGAKHPDVAIVAVLHDVVEDGGIDLGRLRGRGFTKRIVDAIDALTRRSDESYEQYLQRVKQNQLAVIVKRLDIDDNADPSRIALVDPPTARRLAAKYEFARERLTEQGA